MRSRSSWSRRRSPPESSPTRVHIRSPVKPNRSASCSAVISRPLPSSTTERTSSTASRARLPAGSSTTSCERYAVCTVRPTTTRPESGASSCSSSRSSVVLPAPLTPTRPIRSPGPSRQVTSSKITRSPRRRLTSSTSKTVRPSRAPAKRVSSTESRGAGSSAIRALAASIRNCGFDVRAGGPRRSQASSLRSRFCLRSSVAEAMRARSALASTYAAYPPSYACTSPSATSHVVSQTASRNHRSWVTATSAPRRAARWRASQSTPSTSRWLVGSSSSRRSGSSTRSFASATRLRSPPDSGPISPSRSSPASNASASPRVRGSDRHACSGRSPTTAMRTVRVGSRSSLWLR